MGIYRIQQFRLQVNIGVQKSRGEGLAVVLQQNKNFLLYEQTISYKYDILHVILYLQQIAGIIKHAIMARYGKNVTEMTQYVTQIANKWLI